MTADARRRAEARGAEIEVELVPKRSAEALIEAAEERDARMIVVGSGSEGPLKGAILGSTPHKLLHLSQRPVLVVPACDGIASNEGEDDGRDRGDGEVERGAASSCAG